MRRLSGRDGYVTLAVLLTAALLAAIVSGLVAVSRPALGLVRIGADEVTADALLQGGVTSAAYLLFHARRKLADVDGLTIRRATGAVEIAAADEAGRIDLNAARPELLMGLYAAVGGSAMPAASFAARVADWRDQDDETSQEGGAEADEYEREHSPHRPPNRSFRSVAEMRYLLGLSGPDFERLEPFVTVHTGQGAVDPLSAEETVLMAIPGLGREQVRRILEARREGLDREQIGALVEQGREYLSTTESSVYRVAVAARLEDGFTRTVEAVIMPPVGEGAGYRVAAWSRLFGTRR